MWNLHLAHEHNKGLNQLCPWLCFTQYLPLQWEGGGLLLVGQ